MLHHEVADWPRPPTTASRHAAVVDVAPVTEGARGWFRANPSVLHFGGFEIGREYHLDVEVVNVMHESKRMQILPPTTSSFKISYDKKGYIAPGMAQPIRVTFVPTEYQYYYDCIRVQYEAGNLPIAVHGYPTANTVEIPSRVDFGTCALAEAHQKTISIACSIPMPFSFKFNVVKGHSYIQLSPMQGTIPANDSAVITVTFTPLALETATMEVDLVVDEFGFEPKRITISGSSASGIVRQQLIQGFTQAIQDLSHTRQQQETETGVQVNDKHVLGSPRRPRGVGSGAVVDAGATWIRGKHAQAATRRTMPGEKSSSIARSKSFTEKLKMTLTNQTKAVDVPDHFNTQAGVNAMLTQVPGKMKTKDMKNATRSQADITQNTATMAKSTTFAPPPRTLDLEQILLEESVETRQQPFQLRQMMFMQECNNIREYEKSKLLRANEEFVGSKLLSEDDIEAIQQNRLQLERDEKEARWELDKRRTQTLYKGADEPDEFRARPTTYISNVRLEDIVAGSAAPSAADVQSTLTFDPNTNDEWRKRMSIQRRLIAAVSKVVVQRRAARRLLKIKQWIGDCKDKQTIRRRVHEDHEKAAIGAANATREETAKRAETIEHHEVDMNTPISALELSMSAPAFRLQEETRAKIMLEQRFELVPEMFRPTALPRYVAPDEGMQTPKPFNMELITFDDRTAVPFVEQSRVEAMGYEQQSYVTTPFYFPADPSRDPLEGGLDESCMHEPKDDSLEDLLGLIDGDLPTLADDGSPQDPVAANFNLKYLLSQNVHQDLANAPMPSALFSGTTKFSVEERYLSRAAPYYLPRAELKETDPDWEINTTPLEWQEETTIEKSRLAEPGYLAVACYKDMPTISRVFLPDTDRHKSGLYCYENDHLRLPFESDPDLPDVKRGVVDKEDVLTDSESDDDDAYPTIRPSIARNRTMWRSPSISDEAKPDAEGNHVKDPTTLDDLLQAMRDQVTAIEKRTEVVELPRQQIMLAQADELTEQRKKQFSALPDRLAAISRAAPALHLAIPVQMPFHTIEDKLYEEMTAEEAQTRLHAQAKSAEETKCSDAALRTAQKAEVK